MSSFHPFHIVSLSPWPALLSLSTLSLMMTVILSMNRQWIYMVVSLPALISVMTLWWRDVVRESTYQGTHTLEVVNGLHIGFILFILSEVMFFFSFFFSWFFLTLNPDPSLGSSSPPAGLEPLNLFGVPMLNTVILLSSGVTVTWAHHSILSSLPIITPLLLTVSLGLVFSSLQLWEYMESSFTISDSAYGSMFFIMTGFHGVHVILGTVFLLVSLSRAYSGHFSYAHHMGLEAGIWYWHFVDVIWLLLFICLYWWGS
nr:cytochrome c oxidase subunit 3 [Linognathus vituli]